MRKKTLACILAAVLTAAAIPSDACTSVIVSGRKTADGRPLMWKNRDTDSLDNSIRHFCGERYRFIGLVNSSSPGGEVWAGINTAGFAIMNTASYCLNDDDVPPEMMDKEGILMYRALEICGSLEDFEHFLDTLPRPLCVEANFGCIDALGGAAWYETGNYSYVKRDVNESQCGYDVVTNFSWSGDKSGWKGVERWQTASAVFREMDSRGELSGIHPLDIIDSLSRSYRHEVIGIDLVRDSSAFLSATHAVVPDLDFIPRKSTSAAVVIHGTASGGDPSGSVLWAALGYPPLAVTVPVPVSECDHVPETLSGYKESGTDTFCGLSLYLKRYVFPEPEVSNSGKYARLRLVLGDTAYSHSTLSCCRKAESAIREAFSDIYEDYVSGDISLQEYLDAYDEAASGFMNCYEAAFGDYIRWRGPLSVK